MVTDAFICDVESCEESVDGHQHARQACSYTFFQVTVLVLAILLLAVTGGLIWMKLSQNNPSERVWTITFKGDIGNFTSPRSEQYLVFGKIFTNSNTQKNCKNTFRLLPHNDKNVTQDGNVRSNDSAEFFVEILKLDKGTGLRILLNCEGVKIDESMSFLRVHQLN